MWYNEQLRWKGNGGGDHQEVSKKRRELLNSTTRVFEFIHQPTAASILNLNYFPQPQPEATGAALPHPLPEAADPQPEADEPQPEAAEP